MRGSEVISAWKGESSTLVPVNYRTQDAAAGGTSARQSVIPHENCVLQSRDTNSSKQGYKNEPGKEKARTLSYPILQDPSHLPKSRRRQKAGKLWQCYTCLCRSALGLSSEL